MGWISAWRHVKPEQRRSRLFEATETYRRPVPKVGRNDPCPCASGKKFKKCCGNPIVGASDGAPALGVS